MKQLLSQENIKKFTTRVISISFIGLFSLLQCSNSYATQTCADAPSCKGDEIQSCKKKAECSMGVSTGNFCVVWKCIKKPVPTFPK